MAKTLITKPFRCAFPSLTEPKNFQGQGALKYSIIGLIPKSDKGFKKQIEDFIVEAVEKTNWTAAQKKAVISTATKNDGDFLIIKNGELKDLDKYPFFNGHFFINLKRGEKGGPVPCYYPDKTPVPASLVSSEIYSGCWVRANISAWCYEKPKMGVTLQLIEIQKVKDDESFRQTSFDAIEAEETESDDEV